MIKGQYLALLILLITATLASTTPVFAQGEDAKCLATVIMSEASIGTSEERIAVAWTVFNRVNSPKFPKTICEVTNQPSQYATNQEPTPEVLDLAKSLITDQGIDPTGGAIYFFSPRSMPTEGEDTSGYDVGGGLHDVTGIDRKVYFPSFALTNEYVGDIQGVRPAYYMFYRGSSPVPQQEYNGNTNSNYQGSNTLGERVATTQGLNVRSDPGTGSNVITTEAAGTMGTIISGPTFQDDYWWWQINFDDGTTGWSADNWLSFSTEPSNTVSNSDSGSSDTSTNAYSNQGYSKTGSNYQGSNSIGERIVTTQGLHVRSDPGTSTNVMTTEAAGTMGNIINGPIFQDDYWWWQVSFDDGTTGWSADDWLGLA